MGSITLDETKPTGWNADTTTGWATVGSNVGGLAAGAGGQNGVPPLEGTNTVEFHGTGTPGVIGLRTPILSGAGIDAPFDVTQREVGLWFLNPKANQNEAELLVEADNSVRLRLYSGANQVDYYQNQWRLPDGKWQGGWMYLRASGGPGSEDAIVAGVWGTSQAQNVDAVALIVNAQNNNDNKNALEYQVDYVKHHSKITVEGLFDEGGAGERPWSLADIYAESLANVWGVVNNLENFYKFYCALDFGDGTAGEFLAENEYIYLDHSSSAVKYDIAIKTGFKVTLGEKNIGTLETYSQNGVQLVATEDAQYQLGTPVKCAPDFTVESGGILETYEVQLQGFGTINLGGGGTAALEHRFTDFYDNDAVEWRSTGLIIDASRFHADSTDKVDLTEIFNLPDSATRITIFNCLNGITVRADNTRLNEVIPLGGSTYDIAIQNLLTLELVDSDVDDNKLVQVT